MDDRQKLAAALARELADEGKLIEAGWIALRVVSMPADAPEIQISEMRKAFMAGAQHLFASIMGILEPGEEPSEKDLKRMDLIHAELEAFRLELERDLPTAPRPN